MTKIASFTDLKAWQETHKIVTLIYKTTEKFPHNERYGLTNQLRRAAVSISSNIAEGFSKKSRNEKIQFYSTALASLTEVQNQILIAKDVGYLAVLDFDTIAEQTVLGSKLINGLIRSAPDRHT